MTRGEVPFRISSGANIARLRPLISGLIIGGSLRDVRAGNTVRLRDNSTLASRRGQLAGYGTLGASNAPASRRPETPVVQTFTAHKRLSEQSLTQVRRLLQGIAVGPIESLQAGGQITVQLKPSQAKLAKELRRHGRLT